MSYSLADVPSPDNGLVQQAGIAGIESPADANLQDNQAGRIIATSVVLMILSGIAVALRFLARKLSKAGFWWDDWTILLTLALSWGCALCMIAGTTRGFGRHAAYYPNLFDRVRVAESYFKIFYAYETFYTFAVAACKYSILLFYMRIFTERPFRIAVWIMFAAVTTWLVAIQISVFAECVPITGLWELSEPARCIDIKKFFVGSGVPNLIFNVIIVFLPVPMIWTLDIERKHRWALSGVFGLGIFVIIVSLIRVIVLANVSETDITWNFVDAGIWTSVEPAIAVVSACLPILRSLWVWYQKRSNSKRTKTLPSEEHSPSPNSGKPYTSKAGYVQPRTEKHSRYGSDTTPINELPTEPDHQWSASADAYSPLSNNPSRSQSTKKSRYRDQEDINMDELPIQKQEKSPAIDKALPTPRVGTPRASEKNEYVAELYGS